MMLVSHVKVTGVLFVFYVESFELPKSVTLTTYIQKFRMKYRKQMFFALEPKMEYSREGKEQEEIIISAKRVLWR